MVMEGETGGRS